MSKVVVFASGVSKHVDKGMGQGHLQGSFDGTDTHLGTVPWSDKQ